MPLPGDLPLELIDIILTEAARGDVVTAAIFPFVCIEWNLRRRYWDPSSASKGIIAPPPQRIASEAAREGRLEVLKWLKAMGAPMVWACYGATQGGHLDVLQWLRSVGCPWDLRVSRLAATRGDMKMLRWVVGNGCECDREAAVAAARAGDIRLLASLKKGGYPWDDVTASASRAGRTELQWLREAGGRFLNPTLCEELVYDLWP